MPNDTWLLALNFFIAIIPAIALCVFIYYKDSVEKEPIKLLLTLFFLGMLIAYPVSYVENFLIRFLGIYERTFLNLFVLSFFVISLTEEGFKYIITFLGVWKNKKFNYIYDGIVYATFTSLGFALFENVLYVMHYGTETGLIRAVISVPSHGFFSIVSGYFLGLAKFNKFIGFHKQKRKFIALSILSPIILHGIFDYMLFIEEKISLVVFYLFVVLMYVVSFLLIKKVSKTQMTTPME